MKIRVSMSTTRKRKVENGPCSEFLEPLRQDLLDIEGKLSELPTCTDLHTDGEPESTSGQHCVTEHEQDDDEPTGSPVRRDGTDDESGV